MKTDYQLALDEELRKEKLKKFQLALCISAIPLFLIIALPLSYIYYKEVRLFIGLSTLIASLMLIFYQAKILMEWFK